MAPRPLYSSVLAQVNHDGPASAFRIADALGLEVPEVVRMLDDLRARRQVTAVVVIGSRHLHYETTAAGRLEAAGGAQTSLMPRPRVAVQPALF